MAITREVKCISCGKPFTSILNQEKCNNCIKKEIKDKKINWLAERRFDVNKDREKTLEERIDWIEEWIYQNEDINNNFPV